jgi:hypothetical protein
MATCYFRMSSLARAEAAVERLASVTGMVPSRPLGYAHRYLVRVDHDEDDCPEGLVREIDVVARLVPAPAELVDARPH